MQLFIINAIADIDGDAFFVAEGNGVERGLHAPVLTAPILRHRDQRAIALRDQHARRGTDQDKKPSQYAELHFPAALLEE